MMRRLLPAVVLGLLATAAVAPAAAALAAPPPAVPSAAGAPPAAATAAAAHDPVPVPTENDKVRGYYQRDNAVFVANYVAVVLTAIVVLFTGLSARMRTFALRVARVWPLAILVYLVFFAAIDFLIGLPVAYYAYLRDRDFGVSQEQLGAWFKDQLLELPVGVLFVAVLMIVFYTFLRWSPRRWWLYVAIPVLLVDLGSQVVSFATQTQGKGFGPVKDASLAADARALATRAGVGGAGIFQAEKVKGAATVGALLGKPRIVLQDPATAKLSAREELSVLGRALGAYRLRQAIKYSLMRGLLSIVGFYLLYRAATALIARFKDRFGFDKLSDIASWPLFPALFNVFFLLVKPMDVAYARHLQQESDRFGLELVQDNRACAESLLAQRAGEPINPRPGPVYELFRGLEPPLAERVEFCNQYRPWDNGQPLEYGALFAANHATGRD
jgi:STE24 endopeptidase